MTLYGCGLQGFYNPGTMRLQVWVILFLWRREAQLQLLHKRSSVLPLER